MLAGHVHLDGALDLLRTGMLFDDVDLERLLLQCSRTLRLKIQACDVPRHWLFSRRRDPCISCRVHGRSDQRISKHAQLGASYFDARLIATELFFYSGARLRGGEGGAEVIQ